MIFIELTLHDGGPYYVATSPLIYSANHHIHSEYRKIRTRNNSVFGHFSRTDQICIQLVLTLKNHTRKALAFSDIIFIGEKKYFY